MVCLEWARKKTTTAINTHTHTHRIFNCLMRWTRKHDSGGGNGASNVSWNRQDGYWHVHKMYIVQPWHKSWDENVLEKHIENKRNHTAWSTRKKTQFSASKLRI